MGLPAPYPGQEPVPAPLTRGRCPLNPPSSPEAEKGGLTPFFAKQDMQRKLLVKAALILTALPFRYAERPLDKQLPLLVGLKQK